MSSGNVSAGNMSAGNEFRTGLDALAARSVGIMAACANAESAKLYLVLPFLGWLGYDTTNPYEVYPNHLVSQGAAGLPGGPPTALPAPSSAGAPANVLVSTSAAVPTTGVARIDFAVLRGPDPVIAIAAGEVGGELDNSARALRAYFDAARSVKLGIATDGVVFDLYVDADEPGRMDAEPFLSFDLEGIARGGLAEELLEPLAAITKPNFDPSRVAELAHVMIVKRRLRKALVEEVKGPTLDFCRFALERIGLRNVRSEAVERHYAPLIRDAFEESLVLPVLERLRGDGIALGAAAANALQPVEQRLARAERELSMLAYVRRRLAYLIETEAQFAGLDDVHMKDYVGRTTFYYHRERKGRLFDLIEAADGCHKYVFPDPIGAIATNRLGDLDEALKAVYETRVLEMGSIALQARKARIA